jgi:hypothetical protein
MPAGNIPGFSVECAHEIISSGTIVYYYSKTVFTAIYREKLHFRQ